MKIAIDLDEVLGDFVGAFLRWYNHRFGTKWTREDIVHYYVEDAMNISKDEAHQRIRHFYTEEVGNISPLVGAVSATRMLAGKHDLFVISARHSYLRASTEQWLEQHFPGIFEGVHLTQDGLQSGSKEKTKAEICKELGCKVLVDDASHHVEPFLGTGIQVIIFNHPWNVYHRFPPSVKRADSWQEVIGLIEELDRVHV